MTKLEKLNDTFNFFDTLSVEPFIDMELEELMRNNFPELIDDRIGRDEVLVIIDNLNYYFVDMEREELEANHKRLIRILEDQIYATEEELGL